MNDTLKNLEEVFGEDSWFDPSQSKSAPIEEGSHTSVKVTDLVVKEDVEIQGKFLADIYEPVFSINGREVKHKGLFRFKKPNPSKYPHLQADMGSNSGYYNFCKQLGIAQEKDGKVLLPQLTLETLKTYEYDVEVVNETWTGREGNEMKTPRVKFVKGAHQKGELVNEEDLPF
tara:strand:+ start:614 stop:1132 length:519 start_codon:yes stop_codon:yes gene_type:complete